MTFPSVDSWVIARLLADQPVNGELALVSDPIRPLAELMVSMKHPERICAWQGALASRPDHQAVRKAVADADPDGPAPVPQAQTFATAADVRRTMAQTRWQWDGWIPKSRVVGIAATEGAGKTRFGLDLARRIYREMSFPDGQPATFPAGTKTLWLCSDGHQDEIAEALPSLGLPDDAVVFPAPPDDPYANTDLDSPETLQWLDQAIAAVKPGIVFVDTLTFATARDLCEQRSVAALKGPLIDLVQRHQTIIALLLHVSMEGQALGRRIKGITRTLMHLECPDPEHHPDRLRLWVEKSFAKKPPALGVTIKADGNDYDTNPPAPKEQRRGGRPAEKLDKAIAFLEQELGATDWKGCELISKWEAMKENKGTLFNAKRKMEDEGRIVVDDSKKPQIWHLVNN
jgi:hypothetical protein